MVSRGSGKGREIHADMTLQLRQCYRNQVNKEGLLSKLGSIFFQKGVLNVQLLLAHKAFYG